MLNGKGRSKRDTLFALTASFFLVLSSLLIGISIEVPTVEGGSIDLNVGNLELRYITDHGRILMGIEWGGQAQSVRDSSNFGFIGLVIDHDGYDHTPGFEDIADPYDIFPYVPPDDLTTVDPITMVIDNGTTQKSVASFKNSGTADPNDILITQTAWSIVNKDWSIIQWKVLNTKGSTITGITFSIELPLSKDGSKPNAGVGGDNGDDIDGFNTTDKIYWAQDDNGTGTCIGFASASNSTPINHYFSKDYHVDYTTEYRNFHANETWLYERVTAPNSLEGSAVEGNRTANIGWNGVTLNPGEHETFTLIIAANNSFNNMKTTVSDARYYYENLLSGFQVTEFSDEQQKVEVYNNGKDETNMTSEGYFFSVDGGLTPLAGNWDNEIISTYEYGTFTFSGTPLVSEGDTFGFYQNLGGGNVILIDGPFSYGQEGIIPDPISGESTARSFNASAFSYTDEWLRSSPTSWNVQNSVGFVENAPPVVINRVMFNPLVDAEGYVELMYTGNGTFDISGWTIVCDDVYTIPAIPALSSTSPFYVFTQSDMPSFFTIGGNMDAAGDNIYLYNASGNLTDMVGWSSAHTQGKYMSRTNDGMGSYQGFNDPTSIAAGWSFDHSVVVQLTEFYADPTTATIELYNPRGGDKVLDARWSIDSLESGGQLTFTWNTGTISANGGHEYTTGLTAGTPGVEGDKFSLYYNDGGGPVLIDIVSYGVYGMAPDPLSTESTARYWDSTIFNISMEYTDDWTRDISPTWGAQNDVLPINKSSFILINEMMYHPSTDPDGHYISLIMREPGWASWPITDYTLVSDAEFTITGAINLGSGDIIIIKYSDFSPASDNFFNTIDFSGDNVYLYDPAGRLCDMIGWNSSHLQGMSVRRIPDGNGTYQGYNDISSEGAGWVFNTPMQVLITEISDDSYTPFALIEVYNPVYPTIDFSTGGYTFENSGGTPLTGIWTITTADEGQYALFNLTATGLDSESDMIYFYQNGYLVESISYGIYGTVPDPLANESVQRYYDGLNYTNLWGRNWSTGPNFGAENNIPTPNLTSKLKLNEVMFFPNAPADGFVEVLLIGLQTINITGYKIVCDKVYEIQNKVLDTNLSYFYLFEGMDSQFFLEMQSTGDNVYLYDDNGSFLDMVGWNSQHTQGQTMTRVPNGNGTRDGFDDVSSVAAGWRFDQTPSVKLIDIDNQGGEKSTKYGDFGGYVIFNLTITNFQSTSDLIDILNSSEQGWQVEVYNENQTQKISQIFIEAGNVKNITVKIILPDTIPFVGMDNVTLEIHSSNSDLIKDEIVLNPRVLSFIYPEKSVSPSEIYILGSGDNETAQITLNLTGMGSATILYQPQDVIFCVDNSGSMDPLAIDVIKEGLTYYVDEMANPDQGAVITFGGTADLLNPLSQDYAQIKNDTNSIPGPNGGSFMVAALQLAITELNTNSMPGHLKAIILSSDGMPTDGTDDDVRAMADQAALAGIMIFTIGLEPQPGFGVLGEQLLKDVANITGGEYYYAPTADEIPLIYNIISEYVVNIAGRDTNPFDNEPMVRDVLPPWINVVPGSFSIPPDTQYINATGYTIIEWNISSILIDDTWSVSFNITSSTDGYVEANNLTASRIRYVNLNDTTVEKLFPLTIINVLVDLSAPDPPLNLIATAGVGYIELTWDPPISNGGSPITNYRVYKGTSPGSEAFYMEIGNITDFNDTSVTPGITYYYKVSAVNINGEGPLSNEAYATPPTVPFAPLNLIAMGIMGYINLTWDEPASDGGSPVINYTIYRGTSSGSETFYVMIGNITSYDDTNVTIGITYYYRVSAVNIVGEGLLSNEASATPLAVPSAPLNLAATPGNGYIVLTWDEPVSDGGSQITNYRIYRSTSPGSETFYWQIENLTTYNDTNVLSGITYYYKVSAVNTNGEGPLSNEASATPPNVPYAPLNLTADSGVGYIKLNWDEPTSDGGAPITNYRIFKGTTSGSETFFVMIGNLTTYNDTNVSPGVTYYYRVSAVNMVGEGPLSNQASATPPTVPSAPLNLSASAGDGFVNLTWDVPSSDGGSQLIEYHIYRDDTQGIYATVMAVQLWFNDTNVVNYVTYTYNVSAVNEVGEGPNATIIATPIPPIYPSPPMNLMASPGDGEINVSWEPPSVGTGSPITSYNIYRNDISGIYITVQTDELWFVDINITPGSIYYYQVTAVSDIGEGEHSTETNVRAGAVPSSPTNVSAFAGDSYVYTIWDVPFSDGGYQITNYTIYRGVISGEDIFLIKIGNESFFNDTDVVNDLTYYYKILAVNSIGEGALSEPTDATPFAVNRPPTVTITSPSTGTTIKDTFEILGTASDDDGTIQRVEISLDGENWIRAQGTTVWSYEWDTTSVSNGQHTITARAFDGIGYSPETNITIMVNNPESKEPPKEEPLIWILITIAIIVVVLLFVLWFLRKKQPQDMPDDKIFDIIKQKFDDGDISSETFEDFKKRYKKE